MHTDYSDIMERIEAVRLGAGLNKSRFAGAFGMKPQTYNNFIGGQQSKPNVELLRGVAQAFAIDANWLLFGEGREPDGDTLREQYGAVTPLPSGMLTGRIAELEQRLATVEELIQEAAANDAQSAA